LLLESRDEAWKFDRGIRFAARGARRAMCRTDWDRDMVGSDDGFVVLQRLMEVENCKLRENACFERHSMVIRTFSPSDLAIEISQSFNSGAR